MKFIHISDLHLGKRVNEFSMLEDQRDILKKILTVVDEEKPEAVFIAGDVYDKSIPPIEAIQLFDDFLCQLSRKKVQTFIISGNQRGENCIWWSIDERKWCVCCTGIFWKYRFDCTDR